MPRKVYIDVMLEVNRDGIMRPVRLLWEDGRTFPVERILEVCPVTEDGQCQEKAGGSDRVRYTCLIDGKRSHIFKEKDRWYVQSRL